MSLFDLSPTLWVAGLLLTALMARGAWRGYKRGPLRQLAGPAALTIGLVVGWCFGPEAGHTLLHGTDYPWLLRGITGLVVLTCAAGLVAYSLFWWLGRRPEGMDEAESPMAGALVGCWTGVLYFSILLVALAAVASFQELVQDPTSPRKKWAVEIRDELADTPLTGDLRSWSPIPERQRKLVRQIRQLMADPEARKRLMAMPEIRALAAHPSLYQAWEDKKVRELLNDKDLSGFFAHPKVRAVLADEPLQKQAESLDLPSIIDRALDKGHK
jgi:hypothetical protein